MTKIYSNKIWEKVKIKAEINEVENINYFKNFSSLQQKNNNLIRKCP